MLQQWNNIKERRASQEQLVIAWLQREQMKTIALADGTHLRLVNENIRNPLNKDQLHTGLLYLLRTVLPVLQREPNMTVEQVSKAMAVHLWNSRTQRHVAKIRRLPASLSE